SDARLGFAQVLLTTGRYAEALAALEEVKGGRAAVMRARALVAVGKAGDAEQGLRGALGEASLSAHEQRAITVELGRVLVLLGRRAEAEPELMKVIEDYNDDAIK